MTPIEAGPIVKVLQAALNPEYVYLYAGQLTSVASLGLLIYALAAGIRLASTGVNLGLAGSIGKAYGEISSTLLLYMVYVFGGASIFGLIFLMRGYLDGWAGTDTIEQTIYDLRAYVDKKEELGFWDDLGKTILKGIALPVGYAMYLVFQIIAVIFVFVKQLFQVLFALALLVTYAWGFIAITSRTLGGSADLTKGFYVGIIGLFVWIFVEKLSLALMAGMFWSSSQLIQSTFTGGTMTLVVWAIFSGLALILSGIMIIAAPFIAYFLSSNQSMLAAYGGMGAAAVYSVMNALPTSPAIEQLKQMLPNNEGDRTRDRAGQKLSDFNQNPAAPAKNFLGGVADTVSNITNGNSQEDHSSSTMADHSSSEQHAQSSNRDNNQDANDEKQNHQAGKPSDQLSSEIASNNDALNDGNSRSDLKNGDTKADATTPNSENTRSSDDNKHFGFDGMSDIPPEDTPTDEDDNNDGK